MKNTFTSKLFTFLSLALLVFSACRRDDNPAPSSSSSSVPQAGVSFYLDTLTNNYVKGDSFRWIGQDSVRAVNFIQMGPPQYRSSKLTYSAGQITKIKSYVEYGGVSTLSFIFEYGYTDGILTYEYYAEPQFSRSRWSRINLDNTLRRGRLTWSDTSATGPVPQIYFQFRPDRQLSYRVEYRNGATVPDTAVKITYDAQGLPKTCFVDYIGLGYPKQFYEVAYTDLEVRRLLTHGNTILNSPQFGQAPTIYANFVRGYSNGVVYFETTLRRVVIDPQRTSLVRESRTIGRSTAVRKDSTVYYF